MKHDWRVQDAGDDELPEGVVWWTCPRCEFSFPASSGPSADPDEAYANFFQSHLLEGYHWPDCNLCVVARVLQD